MSKHNRWIAGLDLTPRGRGVVRFCRWLAICGRPPERSVAVHAVDPGLLGHLGLQAESHTVLERATAALHAFIGEHGERECFERVTTVEGDYPSRTLEAARVFHHARGIVVGRGERTLGRVTRRLLSAPSGVVAVVPPDFEVPADVEPSVVCCCALDGGEGQTVQFARQLAQSLGGTLRLLHVLSSVDPAGSLYMSARALDELAAVQQEDAERELARVADRHDLGDVDRTVIVGSFAASVLEFAEQQHFGLIVCGARHRSGLDRVLSGSRSMELAQASSCPVLVVPSA